MAYTLEELDDAIAESVGPRAWEVHLGPGFSRPLMIDRAATQRWWDRRPEDECARVLREARHDMVTDGCLKPAEGWTPEAAGEKQSWE